MHFSYPKYGSMDDRSRPSAPLRSDRRAAVGDAGGARPRRAAGPPRRAGSGRSRTNTGKSCCGAPPGRSASPTPVANSSPMPARRWSAMGRCGRRSAPPGTAGRAGCRSARPPPSASPWWLPVVSAFTRQTPTSSSSCASPTATSTSLPRAPTLPCASAGRTTAAVATRLTELHEVIACHPDLAAGIDQDDPRTSRPCPGCGCWRCATGRR